MGLESQERNAVESWWCCGDDEWQRPGISQTSATKGVKPIGAPGQVLAQSRLVSAITMRSTYQNINAIAAKRASEAATCWSVR